MSKATAAAVALLLALLVTSGILVAGFWTASRPLATTGLLVDGALTFGGAMYGFRRAPGVQVRAVLISATGLFVSFAVLLLRHARGATVPDLVLVVALAAGMMVLIVWCSRRLLAS